MTEPTQAWIGRVLDDRDRVVEGLGGCGEKKAALAKLEATGDVRALHTLRVLAASPTDQCEAGGEASTASAACARLWRRRSSASRRGPGATRAMRRIAGLG